MANHLIIGLGGTGGKVLAAYRKLVVEKFNSIDPKGLVVDYIYADSSDTDLNNKVGIWSFLGDSVALELGSKVSIKPKNIKHYIDNIDNYPFLKPWIGKSEEWGAIINDPKLQDGAAGQKRRLGRVTFAINSTEFIKVLDSKVRGLWKKNNEQQVTFHVCCGLAGGTGSGSFIDVISQIRKQYSDYTTYKIILYLLLPEEHPNKSWATTANYQPNGYAALQELNALDFQIFKPHDVGERNYNVERLKPVSPYYTSYIITEQNASDVHFDVDKSIPANIAEFLFYKTAVVNNNVLLNMAELAENMERADVNNTMLARLEAGENPEYNSYGYHHSFKFQTFGIKRVAIPEQEIKEFFAYNFLKQTILQSLFNNPTDKGFNDEPIPNDNYSEVAKNENLIKWNLTIPHLCLSRPILDNHNEENWKNINEEIEDALKAYKAEIFTDKKLDDKKVKKVLWLDALKNKINTFFEREYRAIGQVGGVKEFYQTKRKRIEEIAKKVVLDFESYLFQEWDAGILSMGQLSKRVEGLIEYLSDQSSKFNIMQRDSIKTITDCELRMKEINTEWVKIGLFGRVANKDDKLLDKYINYLSKKYSLHTWNEGYSFAKELIVKIQDELLHLKESIDELNTSFNKAYKEFNQEFNSRCNDDKIKEERSQKTLIKFYKPEKVRVLSEQILKTEKYLNEQISLLRKSIVSFAGSNSRFKTIQQAGLGAIISSLEKKALEITDKFFNDPDMSQKIPGYEKLLGENIIAKLKEEFSGNDAGLEEKLEEIVLHASVMAKYDDSQRHDGPLTREGLLIILPEYREDENFLNRIEAIFRALIADQGNLQIERGGRKNEIIVMNIHSNIALRYLNQVGVLRKAYDSLMNSSRGEQARFEIQLESYKKLPSLFKLSVEEKEVLLKELREEILPYVLLAISEGIIQEWTNPETGGKGLAIFLKDEDGFDKEQIDLGKDLEETYQKINDSNASLIQNEAEKILKQDYKHIDKQAVLKDDIKKLVDDLKTKYNNNPTHPEVKKFNDAARKAFSVIKDIND